MKTGDRLDLIRLDWLFLVNYIEIERLQGTISDALYQVLQDKLSTFKELWDK